MLTLKTTLECSLEPLPKKEIAPISLSRLYSDSSPGILVLLQMVNQMSVRAEITREPYVDQLQKIAQIEYNFLFSFL